MSDAPKSAYELALEKLKRQDRERGEQPPGPLSDEQKRAIAGIRSRYDAMLAEKEILFQPERDQTAPDSEARDKLEEEYGKERRRLEEKRDREIAAVRTGGKPDD